MSNEQLQFNPDEELDLTGAGWSFPRANWTITSVDQKASTLIEDGEEVTTGIRAIIEFQTTDEDGNDVSVTMREWVRHRTAKAQQIGQGVLKRLFTAAFGEPRGSLNDLVGATVSAVGTEDNRGFRKLQYFQAATEQVSASVSF